MRDACDVDSTLSTLQFDFTHMKCTWSLGGGVEGWYDRVKDGTVRDRSHGAATPTINLQCN